jgi:hypothetical protein
VISWFVLSHPTGPITGKKFAFKVTRTSDWVNGSDCRFGAIFQLHFVDCDVLILNTQGSKKCPFTSILSF